MAKTKEIKVVKIAGKSYAVGLFWQPVQNEKTYIKEIEVSVQTVLPGANLYALRKGAATQYGLGATSYGHKSGMPSGASAIANALRDKPSAVCVFKLEEGWWFITIRNNLILSEEDTVYTNEDDAKEAFNSMLSIPDWGYKIAPAEWEIEDTTEISLTDLLGRGQAVELRKISSGLQKNVIILLVLAFFGWQYYSGVQEDKAEAERIAAKRERDRKRKLEERNKPPPPPPAAPWEALTSPEDFSKKCTILVINSTAVVPGWDLQDSTCIEKQFSTNWRRAFGSPGWIFEAKKFGSIPKIMELKSKDKTYTNVVGTIDIPFVKHEKSEPNLTKVELQKKLNDLFHDLQIKGLRLVDKKQTVKDPNNSSYSKDYLYTEFKFSDASYRMPLDWVKIFKDIKGLEFDSIKWNDKTRKWEYLGKIYEFDLEEFKKKQAEKKKKQEEEKKRLEEEEKAKQEKLEKEASEKSSETKNTEEKDEPTEDKN